MAEIIQRTLKFPETTVPAYADPVKGLADALAKPPDLVLLDMRMPGMSGVEVFARLHQAHPGVPIVFLTAFGSVEGALLAMRNGAFDYLQKPFRQEDLLLVVKRALSHAELEQEVERLKGRLEALGAQPWFGKRRPKEATEYVSSLEVSPFEEPLSVRILGRMEPSLFATDAAGEPNAAAKISRNTVEGRDDFKWSRLSKLRRVQIRKSPLRGSPSTAV